MKLLFNLWTIVTKNLRTSLAGLICLVALILWAKAIITTDDFLTVIGSCTTLGLFLSKDGATKKEYEKETRRFY